MRVRQTRASKGSQKWIQDIINVCPELLNGCIWDKLGSFTREEICWKSPKEEDNFAEYRDSEFLRQIDLKELGGELEQFWPKLGPQWDAFGKTSDDKAFFLVEAKANIPEIVSSCGAKDKESLKTISERLDETQRWLNCQKPLIDWNSAFYQYANRLAHLYCPLRGMGEKPSPSGEDFSRLAVPWKTTARPRIPFTI